MEKIKTNNCLKLTFDHENGQKEKQKKKRRKELIQLKFQSCSLCVSMQALPAALVLSEESNDMMKRPIKMEWIHD